MSEEAAFYTGLVADLYGPLRSSVPTADPYATFIENSGQPALELGCGGGDPMLDLLERGLDVDGVDSSPDMVRLCRAAGAARGLSPNVFCQSIESLALERRYKSIFLAGPTFNLLPDDDTVVRALRCIRAHLTEDGSALIPLFIPVPTPPKAFGRAREATDDEGRTIRFMALSEERNDDARLQTTITRYERGDESLERPWVLHWHTQDGFRALATEAALATKVILNESGGRADADADSFVFVLAPA